MSSIQVAQRNSVHSTLTGFVSGDRHLSSEQMMDRVSRATTVLAGLGIRPNDHVAIMLRNDFPFLEASYAAQALGAVPVPVNWHYKADEVRFILNDSDAKVLVVHADLLPQIDGVVPGQCKVMVVDTPPEVAAAYGCPQATAPEGSSWNAAVDAAEPWEHEAQPAAPSMIYTSGSTGTPKGVRRAAPLDLSNPVMMEAVAALGITPSMRTVVCGPIIGAMSGSADSLS